MESPFKTEVLYDNKGNIIAYLRNIPGSDQLSVFSTRLEAQGYDIYYKVLTKTGNRLSSAFSSNPYSLQYKKGIWNEPAVKGTRLFVFRNLNCAKEFNVNWGNAIYSCICRGIYPDIRMVKGNVECIEEYIKNVRLKNYLNDFYSDFPVGTVQCGSLKLLEKVV